MKNNGITNAMTLRPDMIKKIRLLAFEKYNDERCERAFNFIEKEIKEKNENNVNNLLEKILNLGDSDD